MKRKVYRYLGLSPWPTHGWTYRPRQGGTASVDQKVNMHENSLQGSRTASRQEQPIRGSKSVQRLSRFGRALRAQRQLAVLYGNLRATTLKHIRARALKESALHTTHLFHLLEQRLGSCLLRTNCFGSFAHVLSSLREGRVCVNDIPVLSPGYRCQPGDILRFPIDNLHKRQQQHSLLGRSPLHLEIDYALGCAIVLYQPQCIELPTTLLIDDAF